MVSKNKMFFSFDLYSTLWGTLFRIDIRGVMVLKVSVMMVVVMRVLCCENLFV